MNAISVSLEKKFAICLRDHSKDKLSSRKNRKLATTIAIEAMQLGYVFSEKLINELSYFNVKSLTKIQQQIISELQYMKGADVKYKPFYPNFPTQVIEASDEELIFNAIIHYFTFGLFKPEYEVVERKYELEPNIKYQNIDLLSDEEFISIFYDLINSNDSLSENDLLILTWYLRNVENIQFVVAKHGIKYKETMCVVAVELMKQGKDISSFVKTATDVLRILTHYSGGDISLSKNTKFKTLPRRERRYFAELIHMVATEEDIRRHKNKWIRLFHNLHIGEYPGSANTIVRDVRNSKPLYSIYSEIQSSFEEKKWDVAAKLLERRPGDFVRKIDYILRSCDSKDEKTILRRFSSIVDKVSMRVLTQLMGNLKNILDVDGENLIFRKNLPDRVIFPKGKIQKAIKIPAVVRDNPDKIRAFDTLGEIVNDALLRKISNERPSFIGKVYIDERLKRCPIPTQQRSASKSANVVARGTRFPFGDDNTLRFFVYWVGWDVDLSASFLDDNFCEINNVSYYNLRNDAAHHSGDITRAPNGASEFIDIDFSKLKNLVGNVRYISMDIRVFTSGLKFKDMETCYAGWMMRSHPKSNEIYDPKTVINKLDLASESRSKIAFVFDLKTKEAIWCDLDLDTIKNQPNNLYTNRCFLEDTISAIVDLNSKMSLYELFYLHAVARFVPNEDEKFALAENKEDADTIFDLYEGITPKDINLINSEFIID